MKKISALVTLSLMLFVGCASTSLVHPALHNINIPSLDSTNSVELGETLLDLGFKSTYPALQTLSVGEGKSGVNKLTLKPGIYYAKDRSSKYVYYYPQDRQLISMRAWSGEATDRGTHIKMGYALPSGTNSSELSMWWEANNNGLKINVKLQDTINFEKTSVESLKLPSFRQQFIYNGKVGNNVKFLYREFSNNYARAPFSQNVQYDLNESKVIGFKGARIEIVEATNQQIKYIARSNFSK